MIAERHAVRNFVLGFATAAVLLCATAVCYLESGFAGVHADENAPQWEARLMSTAVRASVHRGAQNLKNPLTPDDAHVIAGGRLYVSGCAGCHGIWSRPSKPHALYTPIPQLPETGTQYSEAEIYWVVKHGIRRTPMSAYGVFYSEQQLWEIASFMSRIRALPPAVLDRIQSKQQP